MRKSKYIVKGEKKRGVTLEGVGGIVKVVALWVSVLQEWPPLLLFIN